MGGDSSIPQSKTRLDILIVNYQSEAIPVSDGKMFILGWSFAITLSARIIEFTNDN